MKPKEKENKTVKNRRSLSIKEFRHGPILDRNGRNNHRQKRLSFGGDVRQAKKLKAKGF